MALFDALRQLDALLSVLIANPLNGREDVWLQTVGLAASLLALDEQIARRPRNARQHVLNQDAHPARLELSIAQKRVRNHLHKAGSSEIPLADHRGTTLQWDSAQPSAAQSAQTADERHDALSATT